MKKLLVCILALTMIFSASSVSFAADSYTEYFSEEKEFVVTDNAVDWSTYFYSDEENGYLYSRNVDTEEIKLIYPQNVTEHYLWKENIFCVVNGKSIVKITVSGQNPQTVLTTDKDIDQLYVNDDIIFYLMDNAIYRYHINSQTTDRIVQDDYIYFFYPYSNFIVEWGDGNGKVCRINLRTRGSVPAYIDEYTFIEEISSTSTSSTSAYVHGTSLPLSTYPNQSYYTKTGFACKKVSAGGCHNNSHVCTYAIGTCANCKDHNGGAQCLGFAHYIYKQIWGFDVNKDTDKNTKTYNTSTTPSARNALWNLPSGTHARVTGPNTNGHSIIIANVTSDGVYIYHANGSGGCKVEYGYLSFDQYRQEYTAITFTYDALHTFKKTYSFDETAHWLPCSSSGCNGKKSIGSHSLVANSQGIFVCSVCGYDSEFSQNSLTEGLTALS